MSEKILSYGRQWIDRSDIRAVVKVLKSAWLTQGPQVARFEKAFAEYCGAPHAVAVSSGTAGLHLAALAAEFKQGDEVLTTPMTFAATANSILYTNACPRFVDIENRSWGLDPQKTKRAVSVKTKGIITVDFAGQPSVFSSEGFFLKERRPVIIRDACHALGAEVFRRGRWTRVGGCLDEDMTVFSFHPVKHITTGEGGMITTRRKDYAEKLRLLRSHGIERNSKKFTDRSGARKPWHYEITALGFNYRITDIQCALGVSQLVRMDALLKKRREIAAYYDEKLKGLEHVELPQPLEGSRPSHHLYVLQIDFSRAGIRRENVMKRLRERGIGTQVHYIPLSHQPYYRKNYGFNQRDFPMTERYYEKTLTIPLFPAMRVSDVKKVVSKIKEVVSSKCR